MSEIPRGSMQHPGSPAPALLVCPCALLGAHCERLAHVLNSLKSVPQLW